MEKRTAQQSPFTVRAHRVGDMGRIVHRQARLYHEEYGWTADYEALILEITAKFLRQFKPGREYCWVAECDGEIVGSVFVIEESADVARLRMLYVEPKMRGRGLGRHLVEQCISFARQTGYAKLVLWTNDILVSARTIYVACGFKLISEDAHFSFGKQLTGQTWELALAQETAD